VLQFLGLDENRWWTSFASVEDMFEFAAGCRFFWVGGVVEKAEEAKKQLKHNDRQRLKHRQVFRRWIEEYIPACEDGRHGKDPPTRQQTKLEALHRFSVEHEYNQRLDDWRRERQFDEVWRNVIKAGVPVDGVDSQFRAASIRALKSVIMEEDYGDGGIPPRPLKQENGMFDVETVSDFVSGNWKRLGEIAIAEQKVRAAEASQKKRTEGKT